MFPKIFFQHLDMEEDDARVYNELFGYLKGRMENSNKTPEYRICFIEMGIIGIAHIIFLDRNVEEQSQKMERLTEKFKGAIKLLTQNKIFETGPTDRKSRGKYQLAVKSQQSKSEASITFYLKKIEDK